MAEPDQYDLGLAGCTPEPLMSYLKAVGILRLVSEQKDGTARGYWQKDAFWLRSPVLFARCSAEEAKRDALIGFFLREYSPTPIVAPWAGGSGFFKKDNKEAVAALRASSSLRVTRYASVIRSVDAIIAGESKGEKPSSDNKRRLIRKYRSELPSDLVTWIDAALVMQRDALGFAPLLGTGGNDGRLDFTQNFMRRVVTLRLHTDEPAGAASRGWLAHALFSDPTKLARGSVGQFAPGRVGGPNATQGMEGMSADDPWEFILMLEGALMLAGAVTRRFGGAEAISAGFPFTVRAVAAGFGASTAKDALGTGRDRLTRGELWLPLWDRPTRAGELRYLFGEGRADVSRRPARNGADFARAAASLGVDRGITAFSRVAFLKRSGKAFLAVPAGRFPVTERREVDVLREVDPWLERFRSACGDEEMPPRFGGVLRRIDSAVFDFCRYGGTSFFQRILSALGRAEREIANAERLRKEKRLAPIARLSKAWLDAADDGSPEFAVALALAFVRDPEAKVGPLRCDLEPVDPRSRFHTWAEKDRAVVWNAADLATNLANVLQRRLMDAERAGCERLPLRSNFDAPLSAVAAFSACDDLDDDRIEELIWGLMLVDPQPEPGVRRRLGDAGGPRPVAREYALLKLLFLPAPLVPERRGDGIRWGFARGGQEGIVIRPEPRVLPLLRSGRVGEACAIAAQRLRASGLAPMPGAQASARIRDGEWSELSTDPRRAQRLAAALLIPISSASVDRLVHLVCRDPSEAAETFAVPRRGGNE